MKALRITSTLILALGLWAPALAAQQARPAQEDEPRHIQVTILGTTSPFCAYGVQQKLQKLEGVTNLELVLKTGLATLTLEDDADILNEQIKKTVKDAGFEVAKIVRNFESEFPDLNPEPGN